MLHHYGYWAIRGTDSMYWGWMGLQVLAWVLLAIGLVWLHKRYHKNYAQVTGLPTALDILKKRYARGEITQEEFNSMKEHVK